jgi:hypothetical protein
MKDAQDIPFIAFPTGAEGLGYEATQDTAPFLPIEGGFAMPHSTTSVPNGHPTTKPSLPCCQGVCWSLRTMLSTAW